MAEGSTRAVLAALAANVTIAVLKFAGFLLTGASLMLAEAVHSLADSGNQVLLLIGGKRARRRPDDRHPFGYGQERYIYSFLVSVMLFSLGGLFALYEAYEKWRDPQPLDAREEGSPLVDALGGIEERIRQDVPIVTDVYLQPTAGPPVAGEDRERKARP